MIEIRDKRRGIRGFTFIEILVVVTIIAVISGIAVATYTTTNRKARDSRRKADLEQVRSALELCRAEAGRYPATVYNPANPNASGQTLLCDDAQTYLNPLPTDPYGSGAFSASYYYTYNRLTLTTYQLCAVKLEETGAQYCVQNP